MTQPLQFNTLSLLHEVLRREVVPGALCIDATAGKGRDTALLCRLCAPHGRVLAFDIQPDALAQTRALLDAEGLSAELFLDSHVNLARYAASGSVDCVVFNFGRLPGGDPHIFTQAESSLAAVEAALKLLRPGGLLAAALYYGRENGYAERDALLAYFASLEPRDFSVAQLSWPNRPGDPPLAVFVRRER